MNLLQALDLTKALPHKVLFDTINFSLKSTQKVWLVARNGEGKSTLLRVLAGLDDEYEGEVIHNPNVTHGYLSQAESFDPNSSVLDALFAHDSEIWQLIKQYELALQSGDESITELVQKIEEVNWWDYETQVRIVINKLNLSDLLEQKVEKCSGGELKRVALAKLLIEDPELLLLDEPTNHLDLEMIERLETFLKRSRRTMILVTHDRYFLERVCDQIYELDRWDLWVYPGNYSRYLQLKEKREAELALDQHQMKQVVKRETEWRSKMPRGRGKKNVKRVKDVNALEAEYKALRHKSYQRNKKLELSIAAKRVWWKIIDLKNVSKAFGEKKILERFSYSFRAWERVGIIGKNGVGKSTFINMLMDQESLDGWKIQRGETITTALYQQKQKPIDESKKVIDVVKDVAEYIIIGGNKQISARDLLTHFLFPAEQQHQRAHTLSGWEKRRLHLLTVLIKNPNFLILDEPTNDLDIPTLQILEEFLLAYKWCLMVVSHDRFFMDKIVDHLLVFEWDGIVNEFPGSYSERKDKLTHAPEPEEESEPETVVPKQQLDFPKPKKSLSNKEREELKKVEQQMEDLEHRKDEINVLFAKEWIDHEEIATLWKELAELSQRLEEVEERWMELQWG